MIKVCIFDLDGTVLDTVHTIAYYCNNALAKKGLAPFADAEYNYFAGGGAPNLIHQVLARHGVDTPDFFEEVFNEFSTKYHEDVTYKTEIFQGLKEQLDILKAKGYRFAIVSNKIDAQAQAVVKATYGEGYFDYVTGQKPGGPVKPDITEVKGTFDYFGVTPDECLYFGDTSTDMITGKRAGIFTVGVLWGFRGREELLSTGADALLEKPTELAEFVLNYKA